MVMRFQRVECRKPLPNSVVRCPLHVENQVNESDDVLMIAKSKSFCCVSACGAYRLSLCMYECAAFERETGLVQFGVDLSYEDILPHPISRKLDI